MVFNSIEFAFFLPIVFLLYWLLFGKNAKSQNAFLLFASYAFYAFTDWRFLCLIAFTTFCSYCFGVGIEWCKVKSEEKKAKILSAANIVVNLLILGFFKYFNFFVESFTAVIPGIEADRVMIKIALPLGISYYTFSALSYTIDVFQNKTKAAKDIVQLALYISFFPQIIAGPIGRSTYLLPQYSKRRIFQYRDGVDGLRQFLWGLFKKIVVADSCARYVQSILSPHQNFTISSLLMAIVFGAFQVYADFSGYSDMAIGVAKLFGIKIKKNFNNPFFSHNISEFWNRWHISLTSWLKDYVFASMGKTWYKSVIIRNTFIIFLLCGLWHGANWIYIIWGLYNALLFSIYILLGTRRKQKKNTRKSLNKLAASIRNFSQVLITYLLVAVGFFFCRMDSLEQWGSIMLHWETLSQFCNLILCPAVIKRALVVVFMMFVEWIHRNEEYPLTLYCIKKPVFRILIYYLLIAAIICFNTGDQLPLYARF